MYIENTDPSSFRGEEQSFILPDGFIEGSHIFYRVVNGGVFRIFYISNLKAAETVGNVSQVVKEGYTSCYSRRIKKAEKLWA